VGNVGNVGRVTRRGRLAGRYLCAIALMGAGVLQMLPAAAAVPSRPVDRDISSYVLFANKSIEFKGEADDGRILGGNVGVRDVGGYARICTGGRNGHPVEMSEGSQVVAYDVKVGPSCVLWDIWRTVPGCCVNLPDYYHTLYQNWTGPLNLTGWPTYPTVSPTCTGPDRDIVPGAASNLAPGTYGNLNLRDDAFLRLQPGTYRFCSIKLGRRASLQGAGAATSVHVIQSLLLTNNANIGGTPSSPTDPGMLFTVDGAGIGANNYAINFSKLTSAFGRFWTKGLLNLGNETRLTGRFWADRIISDFGVTVELCPGGGSQCQPTAPTTTIAATTTTRPATTTTTTRPPTTTTPPTVTSTTTTRPPTTTTPPTLPPE